METQDPKSFAFRLRATIALLQAETQQGVEDWTSTIGRLKETLAEVEQEESDNRAVASATADEFPVEEELEEVMD